MAQGVCQGDLPLLHRLLQQLGEQQAEGVHQRRQEAPHQNLLPLHRTFPANDQNAGRLEHEELVVAGQQCWEAILLQRREESERRGTSAAQLEALLTGGASSSRSWILVRMSSMNAVMCLLDKKTAVRAEPAECGRTEKWT